MDGGSRGERSFGRPGGARGRRLRQQGIDDRALPIDQANRRIVSELERRGYHVRYVEFDGGYTLRPDLATEALRWFLGRSVAGAEVTG